MSEGGIPALAWPARCDVVRRRWIVGLLWLGLVGSAVVVMADFHARLGFDGWKVAHLGLFGVLFGLVAFGAVQATVGFVLRRRRGGGGNTRSATTT